MSELSAPARTPEPTVEDARGCQDHSCYIAKPKGMGTNGGCRCSSHKLGREILRLRKDLLNAAEREAQQAVQLQEAQADASKWSKARAVLQVVNVGPRGPWYLTTDVVDWEAMPSVEELIDALPARDGGPTP